MQLIFFLIMISSYYDWYTLFNWSNTGDHASSSCVGFSLCCEPSQDFLFITFVGYLVCMQCFLGLRL